MSYKNLNIPKIIICGLKNSGKSTIYRQLINLCSSEKTPKTSPLINYTECLIKYKNNFYYLVDTPFFIVFPKNEIEIAQQKQLKELLETSSLIIWVIDSNQEINNEIINLNKYLQSLLPKKLLILNKIDLVSQDYKIGIFQKLKQENTYPFSSLEGKNLNWEKLLERSISLISNNVSYLPKKNFTSRLKITIFGPPNSGKSTLMNYLLQKNRSVVSPKEGTTQEPVKEWYDWKNWKLEITDTAGIDKNFHKKTSKDLIKSDLVWIVIDATTYPLTKQIAQIIHLTEENRKPSIIIVNKADLISTEEKKFLEINIREKIKSLRFVPVIFISALEKKGLNNLLKYFKEIIEQSQKQFTKSQLAKTIENLLIKSPPARRKGKKLKIYFAKYKSGFTYYFILFVNNPSLVHFSYQRYIVNSLRKNLDLEYLPIKLIFKKSS